MGGFRKHGTIYSTADLHAYLGPIQTIEDMHTYLFLAIFNQHLCCNRLVIHQQSIQSSLKAGQEALEGSEDLEENKPNMPAADWVWAIQMILNKRTGLESTETSGGKATQQPGIEILTIQKWEVVIPGPEFGYYADIGSQR